MGDVFVLRVKDGPYFHGRVITTATNIGGMIAATPVAGMTGWPLVYIYRNASKEKLPIPDLRRDELLVPPLITNHRPWSMGYFEFLENRALGPQDRRPVHAFRELRGGYVDEKGRRVPDPHEDVGFFGLDSFRTIDEIVSRAVGIPVPE